MEHILNRTKEYATKDIYKQFKTFDDFLDSEYFDQLFIYKAGKISVDVNLMETGTLYDYIFALYLSCMQYHISHGIVYDEAITAIRKTVFNMFAKSINENQIVLYNLCMIFSSSKKDINCKSFNQCLNPNLFTTYIINAGNYKYIDTKIKTKKYFKLAENIIFLWIILHLLYMFKYNIHSFNVISILLSIFVSKLSEQQIQYLDKEVNQSLHKTVSLIQNLKFKNLSLSYTSLSDSDTKSIPLLKSTTYSSISKHPTELLDNYTSFLNYMIDSKKSQYYMKINDISKYTDYMKKHAIYTLTKKGILYPPNILDTLSIIDELSVFSFKKKINTSYGSDRGYKWIFNLFDILNLNILYLYYHKNKYYLSPLQNRKTRDELRKKPLEQFCKILVSDERYNNLLQTFDTDNIINCLNYDLVLIHNDNNIFYSTLTQVRLSNIDNKKDFRACYIQNKNRNHIMSISKCNDKNIINTTWEDSSTMHIEDFDVFPTSTQYYWFSKKEYKKLSKDDVTTKIKENEENKTYIYSFPFQSNKLFKSFALLIPSKTSSGGAMLSDDDRCKDIFFEINRTGTCWFTSLINVMFFSDDVSSLCLYQSMKSMPKTIRYIDRYVHDNNQKKSLDRINTRKHVNYIFYLITFMYTSYYILSKDRFEQEVKNKKKWYKIMNKITSSEFNTKLTLFLITTKNINLCKLK